MMADETSRDTLLTSLQHEQNTLLDLLPRFSDEQWRTLARDDGWTVHDIVMHVADSTYGLSLMALGEIQPSLAINQRTGWMDVDTLNEQRRQKNAALSREKAISRLVSAFDQARRAIQTTNDQDAPGPYGPIHTKGEWLQRMVHHVEEHRHDLEQMQG
jgi:uncharacterized damage-inducible protein DinB